MEWVMKEEDGFNKCESFEELKEKNLILKDRSTHSRDFGCIFKIDTYNLEKDSYNLIKRLKGKPRKEERYYDGYGEHYPS
jgi:hypothetical protein